MIRYLLGITLICFGFNWNIEAQTSPTSAPVSDTAILSLDSAISKALQGSPILAGAQASLSAAQGIERQSALFTNPEIAIEAENLAGSGPYRGADSAEYTYSLSQKVELGGKRSSRRSVAGAERLATTQNLRAVRLDVIRDTTIAYGQALAAAEKLKLVEAREALAKEVFENVNQRVGAARDPLIYRNQAEVALATTTLERQNAQRDVQLAWRKLSALWGEGALTQRLDSTTLSIIPKPQALDVYQAHLAESPDLQRYQNLRDAREATLRLEKAQSIPDPALSVGVRDFRESGHQAMVLGVSMPIPVFDRNQGNISRAGADVVQAEQAARQARLQAEQDLHQAWQDWQSAHSEAQQLRQRIIPSAEEALKLSRQGYERGRFSFLEVLNAQRTLAEAQEQTINAGLRQLTAKATVERLTAISTSPTGVTP